MGRICEHSREWSECTTCAPRVQTINPSHYKAGGIEARQVIKAFGLGFNLGNVTKYVLRAGRKGDAVEDLRKALTYLTWEIEEREGNQ